MKFQAFERDGALLMAAPELVEHITPSWFDLNWWRSRGQQVDSAPGRGESYFVSYQGWQLVWRHYRRGGMAAKLSADRYLWTGLEQTRAYAEFVLTQQLFDQGLPVPRPLAGCVVRQGLTYRADLMTARIDGARSLADQLDAGGAIPWAEVGATIARFHAAGLDHVDLNLRNILVDTEQQIYLIDFDRCRLRAAGRWAEGNLDRLRRSLDKLFPGGGHDAGWHKLREGYRSA
ncbi:3-deoxy-D-manno-octulosonic acid kinase [Motiliproteus sediminis]|uniref:3-deoxy-D-manno-octulosonic acid kinase n=1 Tax=Motiliproteus sediminis TaxID=1468178 RepID=UPI001AEF65EE|nr:3-deoxy-D-manno-octulosonic acid kinase [Motiliproteus sediminis]